MSNLALNVGGTIQLKGALTAAAKMELLKPPAEWFQSNLKGPTPLIITDEGRIFGHLALWNSCHTGILDICKAPPRSKSNYAFFNVGEIETADGTMVPCGKLMFCREGNKHAPLEHNAAKASKHYDDSTKIGGYVVAGEDRWGITLAGALRHDLTDEEVQYLRANPPSGDWRPVNRGPAELVAAFAVPVGGFPVPYSELRLVASGEVEEVAALILGPPEFEEEAEVKPSTRATRRKLKALVAAAKTLAPERHAAEDDADEEMEVSDVDGFASITAQQRRNWAKSGVAMPDGSFPITKCSGSGTSAESARRAIGRAPAGKRPMVRAHISKRERALGCSRPGN